jgi:hypothetical protein
MDATTGALVVAALSVIATPLTAWLTFRWTRTSERERWQREGEADLERWDRDERRRRVSRGEDAAKEILTAVDKAQIVLANARKDGGSVTGGLQPTYHYIKQQAELLTDDEAQVRIAQIADNLYYHSQAQEIRPDLTLWAIGHTCSDAAHAILRAYLHGRPLPATPRMARLQKLHDNGGDYLGDVYGTDDDPLDEPKDEAQEDANAES